ncbi:MAG TPA: tetratricopeptide repeat protein, partial [Archangium sp.]|nr:tetratricopeptide repeat protein [Archangium sp.]
MAMTRVTERGPRSPVDEEFLQQLSQGGELLSQGKLPEARQLLEGAHQKHPHHEKARNLLGLAYFKLGLFDRAAELYESLVRDNPGDATLRVNLGLVYLKTNALQRAMRELESATDLQPDHKKAHNYLALALAQAGEYGRAREHFLQAGNDAMVEKMARAIAGDRFARSARSAPAPGGAARPVSASIPLTGELSRFAEDEGPAQSLEGATPELPSKD